jgi:hypothetical protein
MKMKRFAFVLVAGSLLVAGCASRWVSTPVLNEKNAKVSLELHQEGDETVAQNYSHPYAINTGDLERMLNDMAYIEKVGMVEKAIKGQKPEPVFQADESARLAPAVSEALAKATPDQRVRFQSLNRGGGLIFASRRVTEGVVFAGPSDRLNIVFNVINYELGADEPDEVPSDYKGREPTTVTETWAKLVPKESYSHLQQMDNGKTSEVWLVADVKGFKNAPETAPPLAAPQQEMTPTPLADEKVKAPPVVAPEEPAVATPSVQKPVEKPVEQPATQNETIKNKLRLLKELFEDGLINETEYEAEKKKTLENIK